MMRYPSPKSNAERQREFQARNPGYDCRRKATERAGARRDAARFLAKMRASAAAQAVAEVTPPPIAVATERPLLLLPAPVRDETIAAIEALALSISAVAARVPLRRE